MTISLTNPMIRRISAGIVSAIVLLLTLATDPATAKTFRKAKITHYCGGCDRTHKTATGRRWRGRGVAVDPSVIPKGSKVWIAGYGSRPFIADDTGGKVNGRHVDVRHKTNRCTCNKKGVQYRRVVFVRPSKKKGRGRNA